MSAPGGLTSVTLSGVAAHGGTDVWAVGSAATSADPTVRTLSPHWDGVSWSLVPPDIGAYASTAGGMAGRSNHNMWAVGNATDQAVADPATMVLHSTGTAWSSVPSENVGDLENTLIGAAESSDGDVWAVGFYQEPGINMTLVEHYCP